jgi:hypothetical protein
LSDYLSFFVPGTHPVKAEIEMVRAGGYKVARGE